MTYDDDTTQTCPQCGNPVPAGVRFCSNCGLKLGIGAVDEEVGAEEAGVDETSVMAPVRRTVREDEVTTRAPVVMPSDRPWPWGWILGILAVLVGLLLLALLVQELGEGGDDDDTTTTTEAPPTTTATTEAEETETTEEPADTEPDPTDPPATSPPATSPPVTDPPETSPPETEAPVTLAP